MTPHHAPTRTALHITAAASTSALHPLRHTLRLLILGLLCLAPLLRASAAETEAWEGRWKSEGSHHQGRLEAVTQQVDRQHLQVDFTAHWALFHSRYRVLFETKPAGRGLRFQGEKDLGFLYGGVYHYQGLLLPGSFQAQYRTASDQGVFSLTRFGRPVRQ